MNSNEVAQAIAGLICAGGAVLFYGCLCIVFLLRKQSASFRRLIVVTSAATFIYGVGFLTEPLFRQLFGLSNAKLGALYYFEFGGADAFVSATLRAFIAVLPAAALGVLFWRRPIISWAKAAFFGAAILALFDIFGAALDFTIQESVATLSLLPFSLLSDAIGGAVAGGVLKALDEFYFSNPFNRQPQRQWVTGLLFLAIAVIGVAVIYLLFLRRIPEVVTAIAADPIEVHVVYRGLEIPHGIQIATNSAIEQLTGGSVWAVKPAEIKIQRFWRPTPLKISAINKPIELFSVKIGNDKSIPISLGGTTACPSPAAAIEQIENSHRWRTLDLRGLNLSLASFGQEIWFSPKPDASAFLWVKYGSEVLLRSKKGDVKRTVQFTGTTRLYLNPVTDFTMAITLMSDPFKFLGVTVPAFFKVGLEKQVIEEKTDTSDHIFNLESPRTDKCAASNWAVGALAEQKDIDHLVIKFSNPPERPTIVIEGDDETVELPRSSMSFSTAPVRNHLSYFEVTSNKVDLVVGGNANEARSGTLIIAGNDLSLSDDPDGKFVVHGTGQYMLLNGQQLLRSTWSGLEVEIRVAIIGAVLSGFGFLIGMVVRRNFDTK